MTGRVSPGDTAEKSTDLLTALFTATSATCVTGLVTVDKGGDWTVTCEVRSIERAGYRVAPLASLCGLSQLAANSTTAP